MDKSQYKVWVQGDNKDEWYIAKDWQKNMYISAVNYSAGQGHYTYGHKIGPEKHGQYSYILKVSAGYGIFILQNLDTKIERNVLGIDLYKHKGVYNN